MKEINIDKTGIIPKHSNILSPTTYGFWIAFEISCGVIVKPIASIKIVKAFCMMAIDPIVPSTIEEHFRATAAEMNVQRGDNLQNCFDKDASDLPLLSSLDEEL